jgi:phosphopantothenoylcysteine decarboxylase/phosphopantothenate--cysteine ligase
MSKNIIFALTGSIACYKACSVISKLVQKNNNIQCILTKNALNFIGKSTIEGLTQNQALVDMFENKSYTKHIELSKWADIAIVCPATANIINKFASGIGDDFLTTFFLSWKIGEKPFLIFPAMNENMYLHPVTQKSIDYLKSIGVYVSQTKSGYLACGEKGAGRLLEVEEILKIIESYI